MTKETEDDIDLVILRQYIQMGEVLQEMQRDRPAQYQLSMQQAVGSDLLARRLMHLAEQCYEQILESLPADLAHVRVQELKELERGHIDREMSRRLIELREARGSETPADSGNTGEKTIQVNLSLHVQGFSKFVRGERKVRTQIEGQVLAPYQMEEPANGREYTLTIA